VFSFSRKNPCSYHSPDVLLLHHCVTTDIRADGFKIHLLPEVLRSWDSMAQRQLDQQTQSRGITASPRFWFLRFNLRD
jgi:hypothetical protein